MSFVTVLIVVLMMYWCYKLAEKQDRDKSLALLWGCLFGIFAVITYYIIGDKEEPKTN